MISSPISLGPIALTPPLLLAPMAGITDLPFRRLVASFGAGLVVSEMVASQEVVEARQMARARAELGFDQAATSVQLVGREAYWMGEAARYVDLVLPDASIDDLLNNVDAVHVLTSLTGFEALLRGREVITHGQPFYAGWGLTRDLAEPIARRNRVLTLEQLVAATLILYPRYFDPVTGLPCPPEVLSQRFSVGSMPKPGFLQVFRSIQGRLNLVRRKQAMLQ